MMKWLLCIIWVLSSVVVCSQDRVYVSKWKHGTHYDVIFVNNPNKADVCINLVNAPYKINSYKNAWYLVEMRSKATLIVREVSSTNGNRKAVRIYLYKSPKKFLSSTWVKNYDFYFRKRDRY